MRLVAFALALLSLPTAAQAPPFVQDARLVPADVPARTQFGHTVALSGDRLLASSLTESCTTEVYMFARTASGWTEEETLTPTESACLVGASLALDGDIAVIGRTRDTDGRVFVFERRASGWTQTATLVRPGPPTPPDAGIDGFGQSISLDGDRLLVGSFVGATLFERLGDGWTAGTALTTEAPGAFGHVVALSGDRALLGGFPDVAVMRETPGGWVQETVLEVDGERSGNLGIYTLAFDGIRAAAGRPSENGFRGLVNLFSRSDTAWTREPALLGSAQTVLLFGSSLALDGPDLLVGTSHFAGAVYSYRREGDAWVPQGRLDVSPVSQGVDSFGSGIAIDGGRIAIGSEGADDPSNPDPFDNTGAVYVFEPARTTATEAPAATEALGLSAAVPNPASGRTTLRLRLGAPAPVRAVLVDALGRTIQTLFEGVATGETILTVDAGRLSAGVYAVRVSGAGVTEARRLTVVR